MSIWLLPYHESVFKRYHSDKHFSRVLTYKMAVKINWHRYGMKLRHCHPMYYWHCSIVCRAGWQGCETVVRPSVCVPYRWTAARGRFAAERRARWRYRSTAAGAGHPAAAALGSKYEQCRQLTCHQVASPAVLRALPDAAYCYRRRDVAWSPWVFGALSVAPGTTVTRE